MLKMLGEHSHHVLNKVIRSNIKFKPTKIFLCLLEM